MAFQWIADNVTEVVFTALWTNGREIDTVFHVRREEDDPSESARDALNNWQDHMIPLFVNNYTLQGARFTDHNELEGGTGFVLPDTGKPIVGGQAGQSPAPNMAVLVHKNIEAHAGVRAGRFYCPPVPEIEVDENGYLTPAQVVTYNNALDDFHNGLSGAGSNRWVVVHKSPAAGGFSDVSVITGMHVDPLIASQRRRIRR